MPGFELIGKEEQKAVSEVFEEGGILFSHGFDSLRKKYHVREFEEKASLNFTKVCPGIRLGRDHDDQVRVMTPQAAMDAGANFLVVGRPITKNPEVLRENLFP